MTTTVAEPTRQDDAINSISASATFEDVPPLAVGAILARSLSLFRLDFGKIVLAIGIVLLLDLAEGLWSTQSGAIHQGWNALEELLEICAQVVIILIGYARISGRPVTVRDVVLDSYQLFRSATAAWLLEAVAILIGLVVLIIPGLIVMTIFFVVLPACVIERTGAIGSLKRSVMLTKGHRWSVFGLVMIADILPLFLIAAISMPIERFEGRVAFEVAMFVLQLIYFPFSTLISLVAYRALRTAKEGPGVQTLAEVFA